MPAALADQIAAGEVVERPASVVKELLENAIDAKASTVVVEILDSEGFCIRVSDDGEGMSKEEALLCLTRHATSKLRTADDLWRLQTLGFRGEALPAIASVSELRLTTKRHGADAATHVWQKGAEVRAVREAARAPGTTVEVTRLFFNVPARRKFLRSKVTEVTHIMQACLRVALAKPNLRLKVLRNGRTSKEFLPAANMLERAELTWPGMSFDTVQEHREGMRVTAALAPPGNHRGGTAGLHLFVNGRSVQDRSLARAAALAYGQELPRGVYPRGVLAVEVDPADVDVNVHPQKTEVRFREPYRVVDEVTRCLAHALTPRVVAAPHGPERVAKEDGRGAEGSTERPIFARLSPRPYASARRTTRHPLVTGVYERGAEEQDVEKPRTEGRLHGKLKNGLLVYENRDGLHLIEPRLAQSDQLLSLFEEELALTGRLEGKPLLFPLRGVVSQEQAEALDQQRSVIQRLGVVFSLEDGSRLVIDALPGSHPRREPTEAVELLASAAERGLSNASAAERGLSNASAATAYLLEALSDVCTPNSASQLSIARCEALVKAASQAPRIHSATFPGVRTCYRFETACETTQQQTHQLR